jgi:Zn-dependent protease with chaperone function
VNYGVMLLSLCLAIFLTANLALTLIAMIASRSARKRLATYPAVMRARVLFFLGAAPALSAFVIVAFLLVPSYLAHEPRSTLEVPGISLAILAVLSFVSIAWTISRSLNRSIAARRLVDEWTGSGEPVSFDGIDATCYRIEHAFPLVAVVGVFRPRLFIANRVVTSLSDSELKAALAHEMGHLSVRDNLRQWILAVCRDLLPFLPGLSFVKKHWTVAAETAADQYAAQSGNGLDLASALVRIARLVPSGTSRIAPAGALLVDQDTATLASRVESLLEGAGMKESSETQDRSLLSIPIPFWVGAACLAALFATTQPGLLGAVHAIMEHAVKTLK